MNLEILALLFFLYFILEFNYFLRTLLTCFIAKYLRTKQTNLLAPSQIYGICLPSDADVLLSHMSNGRYLREFDFGRYDLTIRNGIMSYVMGKGGTFVVSALTIRYRLPLSIFAFYKVDTRAVWWDEKFLYLEQQLITTSDSIVRSTAYCKLAIIKVNFEEVVSKLFPGATKPQVPEDLQKWISFNELSSNRLKKE